MTQHQPIDPPVMKPPWFPPAALGPAVAGVGLALFIGRYVWLPFVMQGPLVSVFTGGGIGLVVAGVQLWRRRQPMAKVTPTAGLLALLPAALVSVLIWLFAPPGVSADVPLVPQHVPGLTISVPDWEIDMPPPDPMLGALEVAQPGGNGRFVKVQWSHQPEEDLASQLASIRALISFEELPEEPGTVVGHPTTTLRFDAGDGKRFAMTPWRCEETGMAGTVMTFLSLEWPELMALQRRMLASAQCTEVDLSAVPERVFPGFVAPSGFVGPEVDVLHYYARGDAVVLVYPAMDGGLEAALGAQPAMQTQLVTAGLDLSNVRVGDAPIVLLGATGATRQGWTVWGEDPEGDAVRALLSVVTCAASDQAFLMVFGGYEPDLPVDVMQAMADATCP